MRVVLTPTISVNLPTHGNIMSDMKLFNTEGEVKTGDVVRYGGKPFFVENISKLVTIVSMDERKYTLRVEPMQIGCVLGRDK